MSVLSQESLRIPLPPESISVGLPLSCDECVLPAGYAGASFTAKEGGGTICNFCADHQEPTFLGGDQLIQDLNLQSDEQIGVTVSGGKDSLYTWMWLVDTLGPDRVIAFNHQKYGLVHPKAEANLHNAKTVLGTPLIQVQDMDMLPRFQKNFAFFLQKPDAAMVRVAFCAGCRVGISGKMFDEGRKMGITKFLSAASYLELAPFKAATMKAKGGGSERHGLLNGLQENPGFDHGDNLQVIMLEDDHCHKTQLTGGGSYKLYPDIRFFDFDQYFANIPSRNEQAVRERLGWDRPKRSWHFDCQIETFKDLFYYGLLGYTETDFNLSAQIRYGLLSRPEAITKLDEARLEVIDSQPVIFTLMEQLGIGHLIPQVAAFYRESPFLSETTTK